MLIYDLPFHEYNAARGEYLTSSSLADMMRGPAIYRDVMDNPKTQTAAMALGTAAHKLILEGESAFREMFAVGGPINPSTGKCYGSDTQKYAAWLADSGAAAAVTTEDFDMMQRMRDSIHRHPLAAQILAQGRPEVMARAVWHGRKCQVRIDWLNDIITDLKTCADLDGFNYDIKKFMYLYKGAFYRDVHAAATEAFMPLDYRLIAVEKRSPYRVGVWAFTTEDMLAASEQNAQTVALLDQCERSGIWPSGYEDLQIADITR